MDLSYTTGNIVQFNTIDNNGGWGIVLFYADQNTVFDNSLAGNKLVTEEIIN